MADSKRLLELALKGLELERTRLDEEIQDIRQRLNGAPQRQAQSTPATKARPGKKSRLTDAGRKRLSELMRKRWADRRKAKASK